MSSLKEFLEYRILTTIQDDEVLHLQYELLRKTAKRLNTEAHIKGGFCRDIILNIMSEEGEHLRQDSQSSQSSQNNYHLFHKDIKDIDVAIDTDPEIFARTLFDIAAADGLNPIEYWNNGDKTDKGKNISVWSVKLIKGVEPIEIVHFRSDTYDPKTGRVEITDVDDSFSDDFRRDIPWPSLRINDSKLIDHFNVLDRLNSGRLIITTPPKRVGDGFVNKFNPNIHLETVERILRLFKFITTPYNAEFAKSYDSETRSFQSVTEGGFILDPDITRFYATDDLTLKESELRSEIMENFIRWRDNRLLANVFNSIRGAVSNRPYQFIKFLSDFRILDLLFDSNHDVELLLNKTKILEKCLIEGRIPSLSKPYAIFGFGCKEFQKLEKVLDLFSVDKTSIRLARVLKDDVLLDGGSHAVFSIQYKKEIIISAIYDANRSSYESELREFYSIVSEFIELNIDGIPEDEFREYFENMRKRKVLRPILIDYLIAVNLEENLLMDKDQLRKVERSLVECLEARLNGEHYRSYPKLQKIVETNMLDVGRTKRNNKRVRQIINDVRSDVIDRVDSESNIYSLIHSDADIFSEIIYIRAIR
jgi:hypothetical protein